MYNKKVIWFIMLTLFICLFLYGCGYHEQDKSVTTVANSEEKVYDVSSEKKSSDASVSVELGYSDEDSGKEKTFLTIDNVEFEELVNSVIFIPKDQRIEKTEWIEKDKVYRVAIERREEEEGEYDHLRDYIFVKTSALTWFEVTYPSKSSPRDSNRYICDASDFEVLYEDVTFDGNKDILISLGYERTARVYCAYIYSDDAFIYVSSFEKIPFREINEEEKCIEGYYESGYGRYYECKYIFSGEEFIIKEKKLYELGDEGKYILAEDERYE